MEAISEVHNLVFNSELCADLHNRVLDSGWKVVIEETGWEHYIGDQSDSESEKEDVGKKDRDPQLAKEPGKMLTPRRCQFLEGDQA
jgi:hypothetical protein